MLLFIIMYSYILSISAQHFLSVNVIFRIIYLIIITKTRLEQNDQLKVTTYEYQTFKETLGTGH